jgi:hypothetical protein
VADDACSTAAAASSNAPPATVRLIRRADKRDRIFFIGSLVRTERPHALRAPPKSPPSSLASWQEARSDPTWDDEATHSSKVPARCQATESAVPPGRGCGRQTTTCPLASSPAARVHLWNPGRLRQAWTASPARYSPLSSTTTPRPPPFGWKFTQTDLDQLLTRLARHDAQRASRATPTN